MSRCEILWLLPCCGVATPLHAQKLEWLEKISAALTAQIVFTKWQLQQHDPVTPYMSHNLTLLNCKVALKEQPDIKPKENRQIQRSACVVVGFFFLLCLHHPQEQVLRVIWTLHHRVDNISTKRAKQQGTRLNQTDIGILLLPWLGFYQNNNTRQNEQRTNRENGSQHEMRVSFFPFRITGKLHFIVAIHQSPLLRVDTRYCFLSGGLLPQCAREPIHSLEFFFIIQNPSWH